MLHKPNNAVLGLVLKTNEFKALWYKGRVYRDIYIYS
jgi:hypothetical protein